jgi:hypothetical protein
MPPGWRRCGDWLSQYSAILCRGVRFQVRSDRTIGPQKSGRVAEGRGGRPHVLLVVGVRGLCLSSPFGDRSANLLHKVRGFTGSRVMREYAEGSGGGPGTVLRTAHRSRSASLRCACADSTPKSRGRRTAGSRYLPCQDHPVAQRATPPRLRRGAGKQNSPPDLGGVARKRRGGYKLRLGRGGSHARRRTKRATALPERRGRVRESCLPSPIEDRSADLPYKVRGFTGSGQTCGNTRGARGEDQERFCGMRIVRVPLPFDVHTRI